MKVLGGLGEIGSIFTDSEQLYNTLLMLRYAGTVNREVCHKHSLNHRPDTLNAAFLLQRLSSFETDVLAPRKRNATYYDKQISSLVHTPVPRHGKESHVYYTYTVRASQRDELADYLARQGIETKIQHKILMPEQPAFEKYRTLSYPRALLYCNQILSLPIGEHLSNQHIEYVVDCINRFYV